MIALIHSHEDNSLLQTYSFSEQPTDFLVKFAHDAIDNGADVFIGTGVHVLRSIEIYKGKPIFYGMAGFVNELSTGGPALTDYTSHGLNPYNTEFTGAELDYDQQADTWLRPVDFDSMMAECKYNDGKLTEVIIHPLDQGYDLPQAQRGFPRAAHGAAAQRILEQLQKISKPYGTTIDIQGEVGIIHVAEASQGD
jgi:poly-gamma-glutamate synthesis protein (capsule biosynthesis protein)